MHWDKERLQKEQYPNSSKLEARIHLNKHFNTNPESIWDFAASLYKFHEGCQILEVGCGTGEFWREQQKILPKNCKVTLTDFSSGMLDKAKSQLSSNPLFEFKIADVETLEFQSQMFDHVLAHFMLYHPASQSKAINEICRVLKPKGKVGVITTGRKHFKRLDDLGKEINIDWGKEIKSMAEPFCEENAEEQLRENFSKIDKYVFENNIKATDSKSVVDYMKSYNSHPSQQFDDTFFQGIESRVLDEIRQTGYFFIERRVVLYIAQK